MKPDSDFYNFFLLGKDLFINSIEISGIYSECYKERKFFNKLLFIFFIERKNEYLKIKNVIFYFISGIKLRIRFI